jgi:hypothetical protein
LDVTDRKGEDLLLFDGASMLFKLGKIIEDRVAARISKKIKPTLSIES